MKPNDFGKKCLVDQCQKIKITDFLRRSRAKIRKTILESEIEAGGYYIKLTESKTGFGGIRFWFSCPICHKRSGVLYSHPKAQIFGCRECLKLDYRKHRYKGMIEDG